MKKALRIEKTGHSSRDLRARFEDSLPLLLPSLKLRPLTDDPSFSLLHISFSPPVLAFLKAAGESSENSSNHSPSITSLLRSDFGSQSSNNTTTPTSSSLFPSSSSNIEESISIHSYRDLYSNLDSTPISSLGGSYESQTEPPATETPRTNSPPPSSSSQQWNQSQGTRRYF